MSALSLDHVAEMSFVRPSDLVGEDVAIRIFLNEKVAKGELQKVAHNLYYKGVMTRFGMTHANHRASIHEVLRGHSYGYTGYSATNLLNISTQIPARTHVAVIGDYRPALSMTKFYNRANLLRRNLTVMENTVIEILREYPFYVEHNWKQMIDTIRGNIEHHSGVHRWSFNLEDVAEAVKGEKDRNTREMFEKFARDL